MKTMIFLHHQRYAFTFLCPIRFFLSFQVQFLLLVWLWVEGLSGVTALCSWARHFTLTVPLSIQEYKWVPTNCQGNLSKMLWGYPAIDQHPIQGSSDTPSRFLLWKPKLSADVISHQTCRSFNLLLLVLYPQTNIFHYLLFRIKKKTLPKSVRIN